MTLEVDCTPSDVPRGRIDIHSHLLPAVDDGCGDLDETLQCIRQLKGCGFVGSICTPHLWPEAFPQNTPSHVHAWTAQLSQRLAEAGMHYPLWSGGELRMFKDVVDWMKAHGVPTLAESHCVLTDFWEDSFPRWLVGSYEWLLSNRYQPIVAHPERLVGRKSIFKHLLVLAEMGVWFQANARSFTGEDGYNVDQQARQLLSEDRYQFLALDLHGPDTLAARLDGVELVREAFGLERLEQLMIEGPRRLIFGAT